MIVIEMTHNRIFQTLSGKLTWSHYCELMSISDPDRSSLYEKECERSGWSVREMKRQISTSLFASSDEHRMSHISTTTTPVIKVRAEVTAGPKEIHD